ncbi:MAG TPA: hypothetical protein GX396_04895 [Tissierellia bacterium]|nr:hypothetical protein [Tissierellia bacterium]
MLLFRMGPRYLFFRTKKEEEITNFLLTKLNGEITEFMDGFGKASENCTLCFITDTDHEKTRVEDANRIVLVNEVASVILSSIINNQACGLFHRIDLGPSFIVMRVLGNEEKLIERIKEYFSGTEVNLVDGIRLGEKNDTIVAFTKEVITGPVASRDFLSTMILIPQPSNDVREILRLEGLRFITQSLKDSHWYELRINIYDSRGKYKENYDRLIYIFTKLGIGMILGESWTKDYAVMLYFVLTYQVRLFTFLTPQEIKKILVALEYSIDGKRMVDFDLYYKNKKVFWSDLIFKGRRNKEGEAKIYRQELYEKLKPEDIETLEAMERAIIEHQ